MAGGDGALEVVCVLRSGGDYNARHVDRLRKQFAKWAPGTKFKCLSDIGGTLKHNWPGWWSKMAAYEDAREPFLLVDLDTTIVGPIDDILARRELTVLSDFYRPQQIQSSFMLVTPDAAAKVWKAFIANPAKHMRQCRTRERWGDQGFVESVWGRDVARWQDVMPGQFVSWKVDCRDGIPDEARVIISHGRPRPWEVGL